MPDAVRDSAEFKRIFALPRRTGNDHAALAAELTELLKTPRGTMTLRPVQALALHDIGVHGGGFLPIGVGEGKTLIVLLAAYLLGAQRPMLLLPASLIEGTERARVELSKHWLIPNHIRMLSYEMLGRAQSERALDDWNPDALLCDEVHRLKNKRAAVTKRVARRMAKAKDTAFVGASGTVMRDSILDFAHILFWGLKDNAPLPMLSHELEEWASALDEPKGSRFGEDPTPVGPGVLLRLCSKEELREQPVTAARLGFRRRLVETPGVVATAGDNMRVDASIYLKARTYKVDPITDQHFRTLRGDARDRPQFPGWQRPDGKEFEQGVEVWACARQLAMGFHYEWNPPPPDEWMKARKDWSAFVRGILSRSRTLDSPLVVINAIDAGRINDEAGLLARWRAVRGSFKPKTIAVWHDESVLKLCTEWGKQPGIIWTEHRLFAERLAKETGLPYYGGEGLTRDGEFIEDSTSKTIIASIDANKDGKNLQFKWSRNLIVSPPDGWDWWEQTIARTHRPGQKADEVIVDVLVGCREHVNAWEKALAGTHAARDTAIGGTPKLLLADVDFSNVEIGNLRGFRW